MQTGVVIGIFLVCIIVIISIVLGLYFGKVFCPDWGYECPSGGPSPSETPSGPSPSRTPGGPSPSRTPSTIPPPPPPPGPPNCTGRSKLNAAGNACESCSLPTGKGFASTSGCNLVDCPAGQFGGYNFAGCLRCATDDNTVPPGWILQGGTDDCAIIRCQSGTSANSSKTQCVPNPPPPPPPPGCTGYWNNGTQCHMPRACGQRGYYIDTYVVPYGSGVCSVANGSTIDTRLCDNWPQAPPGGVIQCI